MAMIANDNFNIYEYKTGRYTRHRNGTLVGTYKIKQKWNELRVGKVGREEKQITVYYL